MPINPVQNGSTTYQYFVDVKKNDLMKVTLLALPIIMLITLFMDLINRLDIQIEFLVEDMVQNGMTEEKCVRVANLLGQCSEQQAYNLLVNLPRNPVLIQATNNLVNQFFQLPPQPGEIEMTEYRQPVVADAVEPGAPEQNQGWFNSLSNWYYGT